MLLELVFGDECGRLNSAVIETVFWMLKNGKEVYHNEIEGHSIYLQKSVFLVLGYTKNSSKYIQ